LLLNVVHAAAGWASARRTQDRRTISDAELRLLRAVCALDAATPAERRRRRGGDAP
jgi:hypothetical protein